MSAASCTSPLVPAAVGGLAYFVLSAWAPVLRDPDSSLAASALRGLLFAVFLYLLRLVEQAVRRRRADRPAPGRPRR